MREETYKKIIHLLRNKPQRIQLLKVANKSLVMLVYCLYPVLLLFLLFQQDMRFWHVLFVPGFFFIIVSIFRSLFNAPRPYEVMDVVPIINKDTRGKSFPSRHVFSVFVISMAFYYIYPLMGIGLFVVGFMLAVVRVIVGVHFLRDVIVGALMGILSGVVGFYLIL